jgi:hypothetical protein
VVDKGRGSKTKTFNIQIQDVYGAIFMNLLFQKGALT